jgi:DNA-binding MurR/RpiR family transcriptional regulator
MPTGPGVRETILAQFDTLSPKQKQLARFILDNEDMVVFASANEIGERVNASAATVVRFCRALGYEGYTDLQGAVRAQFPRYHTTIEKMAAQLANGNRPDNLPARVAQSAVQSIHDTINRVEADTLKAAAEAIIQARHIRVFGSGLSAVAAILAGHALASLGFTARACTEGRASHAIELSHLSQQDLVIVISIWRYLRDTIDAATAARDTGATCIALTDSPVAPVASLANHVFIASTEGATHSRSLAGIFALIELISATVASRRPHESMAALQRVDTFYRQNNMLYRD